MTAARRPDRARHGQHVSDATLGDCFRASMSVLLDVPNGDHLPHLDHPDGWWLAWWRLLHDLGLEVHYDDADGPIWQNGRWIASVASRNFEGATHAIVMDGHQVLFDPSPRRRYHAGWSLLGQGAVLGGYRLQVCDARRLDAFIGWRQTINRSVAA